MSTDFEKGLNDHVDTYRDNNCIEYAQRDCTSGRSGACDTSPARYSYNRAAFRMPIRLRITEDSMPNDLVKELFRVTLDLDRWIQVKFYGLMPEG